MFDKYQYFLNIFTYGAPYHAVVSELLAFERDGRLYVVAEHYR